MTDLKGRVAIVTGAASGIGRAGALLFAERGARVVAADRDEDGAKQVCTEIESAGGAAAPFGFDAAVEADNQDLVAHAVSCFGQLDVLWANAGWAPPNGPITELSRELFDAAFAVNARGPWLLARAAVPHLRERAGAAIVLTGSLSGLKARAEMSIYQSSKGAVAMLTRSLAKELASIGIRVNSVCPGPIDTPMLAGTFAQIDQSGRDAYLSGIPLGRLGTPDEVARVALFLASDAASFVTGVNLNVDGGVLA